MNKSEAHSLPADHILSILMARHANDNDQPEVCQHHDVSCLGRKGCEQLFCNDCDTFLEFEVDP